MVKQELEEETNVDDVNFCKTTRHMKYRIKPMSATLKYVIWIDLLNCQNFVAIRSAVLEKMTFEVAMFGYFPDIPNLKFSLPPVVYGRPDMTLSRGTSCRVTAFVLFVSVTQEARRSSG